VAFDVTLKADRLAKIAATCFARATTRIGGDRYRIETDPRVGQPTPAN
jgi:hypothetical protein